MGQGRRRSPVSLRPTSSPRLARYRGPAAMALEAPDRRRPRPDAVHALARARLGARGPGGPGPVLVTVEYRIRPDDRVAFLEAITKLADERRRDGAFDWGVFEDPRRRAASSRRSCWSPGSTICGSTNA